MLFSLASLRNENSGTWARVNFLLFYPAIKKQHLNKATFLIFIIATIKRKESVIVVL